MLLCLSVSISLRLASIFFKVLRTLRPVAFGFVRETPTWIHFGCGLDLCGEEVGLEAEGVCLGAVLDMTDLMGLDDGEFEDLLWCGVYEGETSFLGCIPPTLLPPVCFLGPFGYFVPTEIEGNFGRLLREVEAVDENRHRCTVMSRSVNDAG